MAASCAFTLPLGKKLPWLKGTGKYQACITPNQAKKLFKRGELSQPIGCGAFACAYPGKEPDRVVKITNDRTDVESLRRGQSIPFVPKVYKTYRLTSRHRWLGPVSTGRAGYYQTGPREVWSSEPPTVYAMEVERVRPLHGAEKGKWQRRISCLAWRIKKGPYGVRPPAAKRAPAVDPLGPTAPMNALAWVPSHYYPQLENECCPKRPGEAQIECRAGIRQVAEAARRLRKRGIDPGDIHAGNIGVGQDGRWKLIDLGQSGIASGYRYFPRPLSGR